MSVGVHVITSLVQLSPGVHDEQRRRDESAYLFQDPFHLKVASEPEK